ncbi:MAG: cell division protein FtsQ/DivIB [Sulfurihydrogenibium sp.]
MLRKTTIIILWLGICATVGYLSPTLPLIKDIIAIKTINIKGTDKFKEEDIREIFKSQNWFFLTEDYVNEKLKNYPFVKRTILYKPQIGQIDIIIEERKPFAILNYKGKSYVVDKDGEIIDNKLSEKDQLIKINVIDSYLPFKEIISKVDFIYKNLNINPKEFTFSNGEIAIINENNSLLVFSLDNLEEEVKKAKVFFAKNSIANYSYINFSFDDMIIAKK